MLLFGGCVGGVNLGGGPKTVVQRPTVGQELIDLQKARDSGAITPAEYDAKKAELMVRK
ncbi:MAG: SHOCT domain-containing protein [Bryobacteraceae bacterium]